MPFYDGRDAVWAIPMNRHVEIVIPNDGYVTFVDTFEKSPNSTDSGDAVYMTFKQPPTIDVLAQWPRSASRSELKDYPVPSYYAENDMLTLKITNNMRVAFVNW